MSNVRRQATIQIFLLQHESIHREGDAKHGMYCPSTSTDSHGFLMARSTRIFEVRYIASRLVRHITHYPTGGTTEHLLFEGLVRLASSSGLSWAPKVDLADFFPLQVGHTYTFQTEEHLAGRDPIYVDNEIKVLRKEKFKAAGCTFDVLRLETFASNEFKRYIRYAPNLKCVLTEQIGRATGFGCTFHPLAELPTLQNGIARHGAR